MLNPVVYSSDSTEWGTPQYLFDTLNKQYGEFTLDAAASVSNHKCDKYYTIEDDALTQTWEGRVFLNPPYGRGIIGPFIEKAYEEVNNGNAECVVCLLPARTDQDWFLDYCLPYGSITFMRRRVRFEGATSGAPFPSIIVVFDCDMITESAINVEKDT